MMLQEADLLKVILLLAVCRLNPAAAFILELHIISVLLLLFVNSNPIGIYCLISALYCIASTSEIRILSSIRHVLFAIGALHFGAAVEFYVFDYQTVFYLAFPYLIHALDMLTIILLLTGGRGFVGFTIIDYIRACVASFNNRHLRYNPLQNILQTKEKAKR